MIKKRKKIHIIFSLLFMLLSMTAIVGTHTLYHTKAKAVDSVSQTFACILGETFFSDDVENSPPVAMYRIAHSDFLQFYLLSKSGIVATPGGIDKIDNGLNGILSLGMPEGTDFKSVNERILGRSLIPEIANKIDKDPGEEKKEFNTGPKVNPYDRFGVAGLRFSMYQGEWRKIEVGSVCGGNYDVSGDANMFYESRLAPQAVLSQIEDFPDVRSAQFSNMNAPNPFLGMLLLIAAIIFFFNKLIVTLVIALVNFSFTDLVSIIGLHDIIAGDDGKGGIALTLYNNLFVPLVTVVMVFTAIYIFYIGIVKRQFRESLITVLRSIGLFALATIIFTNAPLFLSLPNNIALAGQAVVISSMSEGVAGGNGLCTSQLSQTPISQNDIDFNNPEKNRSLLEQSSISIRSSIGCQFWQMFLLRPYVQAQWGTDWEKLWDKTATIDYSTNRIAGTLDNNNGDWVGDASVPLGNGEFIKNWAIFQISTQTDAHSPLGKDGEVSPVTNNLSNDWWRIVDALSNYQEKEQKYTIHGLRGQSEEVSTRVPDTDIKVSSYWSDWTGFSSSFSRITTSFASIIVSLLGLLAPGFFSFLAAITSIKLSLLMSVSPIFLLMGCWHGGWEMCKGWFQSVINTTIERIILGLLVCLSLVCTSAAIDLMENESWVKGIFILCIASFVLVKFRRKILSMVASFRFTSSKFGDLANNVGSKVTGLGKISASVMTAGSIGAVSSYKNGASLKAGFKAAAGRQLRNKAYASRMDLVRRGLIQYENTALEKTGKIPDFYSTIIYCYVCGKKMDLSQGTVIAARDDDGNFICRECYDTGVAPEASEVVLGKQSKVPQVKEKVFVPHNLDGVSGRKNITDFMSLTSRKEKEKWLHKNSEEIGESLASAIHYSRKKDSDPVRFDIPEELKLYIHEDTFRAEMMKVLNIDSFFDPSTGVFDTQSYRNQLETIAEPLAVALKKRTKTTEDTSLSSNVDIEKLKEDIIRGYNNKMKHQSYRV